MPAGPGYATTGGGPNACDSIQRNWSTHTTFPYATYSYVTPVGAAVSATRTYADPRRMRSTNYSRIP